MWGCAPQISQYTRCLQWFGCEWVNAKDSVPTVCRTNTTLIDCKCMAHGNFGFSKRSSTISWCKLRSTSLFYVVLQCHVCWHRASHDACLLDDNNCQTTTNDIKQNRPWLIWWNPSQPSMDNSVSTKLQNIPFNLWCTTCAGKQIQFHFVRFVYTVSDFVALFCQQTQVSPLSKPFKESDGL